jgi:hypothetical protein
MPSYPFGENPDGSWSAENILGGNYEITVMAVSFGKSEQGKAVDSWHGRINITVPRNSRHRQY